MLHSWSVRLSETVVQTMAALFHGQEQSGSAHPWKGLLSLSEVWTDTGVTLGSSPQAKWFRATLGPVQSGCLITATATV